MPTLQFAAVNVSMASFIVALRGGGGNMRAFLATIACWALLLLAGIARADDPPPPPPPTIAINFHFEGNLRPGAGFRPVVVTRSGLTPEERTAVVQSVQEQYDRAFGEGVITVAEGTEGRVVIVVSGNPGFARARVHGRAGEPGQPGIVYEATFRDWTAEERIRGIEYAVAHEAAHKLGRSGHNRNEDDPSKMTDGSLVPEERKRQGGFDFTEDDVRIIREAMGLGNAEQRQGFAPGDLGIFPGRVIDIHEVLDELRLEVFVSLMGPAGVQFGYMSDSFEFVSQSDEDGRLLFDSFSFFHRSGQDLAVLADDQLCTLSSGCGSFTLFDRNPLSPPVFLGAELLFQSALGEVSLTLDASVWRGTGGFTAHDPMLVPEPPAWVLVLAGFAAVGLALRLRGGRAAALA
jgi:hypothetical protein